MTDPLAEALDLIEHLNMDPEARIVPLILADIAQSLRPHTAMFESDTSPANGMSTYYGAGWPERKGWSQSGHTWLCPEPGCGFGVGRLSYDGPFDELERIGEHIQAHIREHIRERETQQTEPSLVTLDRVEEQLSAEFDQLWIDYSGLVREHHELVGEVRRWREADRIFPPEAAEWWDATDRFRDVADRIGGAL